MIYNGTSLADLEVYVHLSVLCTQPLEYKLLEQVVIATLQRMGLAVLTIWAKQAGVLIQLSPARVLNP